MEKRSIFFMIPTLTGGGAQRVIVTLLKYLDRSRFHPVVMVVDMRNAVYRDEIPSDVEFIDLGATRVRYAIPKIIALIWKRRPDVVFCTLGHLNLVLAMVRPLLPRRMRYIARETTIVSFALRKYSMPMVWSILYRWFYKRHDILVCQSRYMLDDLVENFGYPRERSVVINNPVDVQFIQNRAAAPLDHTAIGKGTIKLVAAGRMVKEKGFDLLIEAVANLADPRIYLIILGEGLLLDVLKHLALVRGVADQVAFVGFQSNPYAWFSRADAFVLSSRYEGFPNVVLETLACGTPVIALPAPGGTREILRNIPECTLAEEVSAQALVKALSDWIAGPRRRVPISAVAPFMLEQIVGHYEKLFLTAKAESE